MTTMVATMAPAHAGQKHTADEIVRLTEMMRTTAALVFQGVFARVPKQVRLVPGVHRTAISRARNGDVSNPLYRMGLLVLVLRLGGQPRSKAEWLVAWLERYVDLLWGKDSAELPWLEEVAADAEQDVARAEAMLCDSKLPRWIEVTTRELAAKRAALAAAKRRILRAT